MVAVLILLTAGISSSGEAVPSIQDRVLQVFASHCTKCHGPDVARPKGQFGHVTDLQKLVSGNEPKVLPFNPEFSPLWKLISLGDMPPEGEPKLSPSEKATVYEWISSGAPTQQGPPAAVVPAAPAHGFWWHLLAWLGRFHVLLVHFPIALLVLAGLGEALAWRRGLREPWLPVRLCLVLGALGAIAAASLGWLHADFGGYGHTQTGMLDLHRWLGTMVALFSVIVALGSEREVIWRERTLPTRVVVLAQAGWIGIVAHLGGSLVHGQHFLEW